MQLYCVCLLGLAALAGTISGCVTTSNVATTSDRPGESGVETANESVSYIDVAPPAAPFMDDKDFRNWFAYYYRHHRSDRLTPALQFMDAKGMLESDPDVASVFVSRIFAGTPAANAAWLTKLDEAKPGLSSDAWSIVVIALWMSKTPDSRTLAITYIDRISADRRGRVESMLAKKPDGYDPLTAEVTDSRQVNLLWAAFNATGDTQYVNSVINQIHMYGVDDESMRGVIGEAAIMSLAHNALYHPAVAMLCERQISEHHNPRTRGMLNIMLQALVQFAAPDESSPEAVDEDALAH